MKKEIVVPWKYRGKNVVERPKNKIGFVYVIENKKTGRKYIGKKVVQDNRGRPVSFQHYWGSCRELKDDIVKLGREEFTRTVLEWCETKSILAFAELIQQIKQDALASDDYYNNLIHIRLKSNPKLSEYISGKKEKKKKNGKENE